MEREEGRKDAANDLSEVSEGEKEKDQRDIANYAKDIPFPSINSQFQLKSRNLYIVLIRYISCIYIYIYPIYSLTIYIST